MLRARYLPAGERLAGISFKLARQVLVESRGEAKSLLLRIRVKAAAHLHNLRTKTRQRVAAETQADLAAEVSRKLQTAEDLYQQTINRAYSDCLTLIQKICAEVLGRELTENPAAIHACLSRALRDLNSTGHIKLLCHPMHETSLRSQSAWKQFSIITSTELPPGELLLQSQLGSVQLSWSAHLESIMARLRTKLSLVEAHSPAPA